MTDVTPLRPSTQAMATAVGVVPRSDATFAQYEENMTGFELQLDPETVHRLNDVSR